MIVFPCPCCEGARTFVIHRHHLALTVLYSMENAHPATTIDDRVFFLSTVVLHSPAVHFNTKRCDQPGIKNVKILEESSYSRFYR